MNNPPNTAAPTPRTTAIQASLEGSTPAIAILKFLGLSLAVETDLSSALTTTAPKEKKTK